MILIFVHEYDYEDRLCKNYISWRNNILCQRFFKTHELWLLVKEKPNI